MPPEEKIRLLIEQIYQNNAFIRAWMPGKGENPPMARQFSKMLDENYAALMKIEDTQHA